MSQINTPDYHYDYATGAISPVVAAPTTSVAVNNHHSLAIGTARNRPQSTLAKSIGRGLWDSTTLAAWDNVWDADYSVTSQAEKSDMIKAVYYWKKDAVVYKCVKLLAQMSNDVIVWDSTDESVRAFFDSWYKQATGAHFRHQWFTEYFRTGFVPVIKTLIPYTPRDYKPDKKLTNPDEYVRADSITKTTKEDEKEYREAVTKLDDLNNSDDATTDAIKAQAAIVIQKQYKWHAGLIPGQYALINPMSVEISGPKGMEFLKQPYLQIDGSVRAALQKPGEQQADFIGSLPIEMVQQIKDGSTKIWMSPNIFYITFADKQDYEKYPTPIISHAFEALAMKHLLIHADMATAEGIRDRILKVTIGSDTLPVTDNAEIDRLEQLFNNPTPNLTIFWNHTLEIEWIAVPTEGYMDKDQYAIWNNEIRTCYGISDVFTGTSSGASSIGNNMMAYEGLKQELLGAQAAYLEFLAHEIRLVRRAMGFTADAKPRYINMFGDITTFMALLQSMFQNGSLDIQTMTEMFGFDFATMKKRMENQKKMTEDELFMPRPSSNNMGPGDTPGIPTGGKPAKSPLADNNKNKKGKSQPKKKASAVLTIPEPGCPVLVVDDNSINDADRDELAKHFSLASASQVVTKDEYESKYGKLPNMIKPLPELSIAETLDVANTFMTTMAQIDKEFDAACNSWVEVQKANSSSKKAPYLRADRKSKIMNDIANNWVSNASKDINNWPDYHDGAKKTVAAFAKTDHEVNIMAALMVQRQWESSQSDN